MFISLIFVVGIFPSITMYCCFVIMLLSYQLLCSSEDPDNITNFAARLLLAISTADGR